MEMEWVWRRGCGEGDGYVWEGWWGNMVNLGFRMRGMEVNIRG